jgi:hypothetical protein
VQFSHRKFGLRAAVGGASSQAAADALVADCLDRLNAAFPVVSKHLIRPRLDAAIDRDEVSVTNMFPYFAAMYEHLRSTSQRSAAEAIHLRPMRTELRNGSMTSYPAVDRARQAEFEAHGALFAFFSMVEHLLLIERTFAEFDPATERLSDFLRMNWSNKFKAVIDMSHREAKTTYDTLKTLVEENRNPAAHGGIDRRATNLAVHLPGYGAVPVGVHRGASPPCYTFHPELPRELFPFGDEAGTAAPGWDALDRVTTWIENAQLVSAYQYGKSGLPLLFDPRSRAEAGQAWGDTDAVEQMIRRRAWLVDQAANMDW